MKYPLLTTVIVAVLLLAFCNDPYPTDPFAGSKPPLVESLGSRDRTPCVDLGSGFSGLGTYDGVEFDSAQSCYFVRLTRTQQRQYRREDQLFVILVPKKLFGGTIIVSDTPSTTRVTLSGIITERYLVGSYH